MFDIIYFTFTVGFFFGHLWKHFCFLPACLCVDGTAFVPFWYLMHTVSARLMEYPSERAYFTGVCCIMPNLWACRLPALPLQATLSTLTSLRSRTAFSRKRLVALFSIVLFRSSWDEETKGYRAKRMGLSELLPVCTQIKKKKNISRVSVRSPRSDLLLEPIQFLSTWAKAWQAIPECRNGFWGQKNKNKKRLLYSSIRSKTAAFQWRGFLSGEQGCSSSALWGELLTGKRAIETLLPAQNESGFTAVTSSSPRRMVASGPSLISNFWIVPLWGFCSEWHNFETNPLADTPRGLILFFGLGRLTFTSPFTAPTPSPLITGVSQDSLSREWHINIWYSRSDCP